MAQLTRRIHRARPMQRGVAMLANDRATLRNVILAMLVSTGGLVVVGTTYLGRDRTLGPVPVTGLERDGARSSAGGVPQQPASMTTITSAQMQRGGSAAGAPSRPPVEHETSEPSSQPPAHAQVRPTVTAPPASPPPQQARPNPVSSGQFQVPVQFPMGMPAGSMAYPPSSNGPPPGYSGPSYGGPGSNGPGYNGPPPGYNGPPPGYNGPPPGWVPPQYRRPGQGEEPAGGTDGNAR